MSDAEVTAGLADDGPFREQFEAEIADVLMYVVRLADVAQIDLGRGVENKLAWNAERYPVDKVRGSRRKMPHSADSVTD